MSEFSSADVAAMAEALRLARRGNYTAHPNPRVGCVLLKAGRVVGSGWHRKTGEAHAEIEALRAAGADARGSRAYVTLEPCSHHGKTPPCADALIEAGVSGVVAAMEDPNPRVAGAGLARLRDAGIDVQCGLLRPQAEALNRGFISRITRGRPFLRLKIAASLDGATAMASGESRWITGADARRDVQRLRALSGAVMTGIATVLDDDPGLTVRDESLDTDGRQPLRVIVDSHLRLPPAARACARDGETIVFCIDDRNRQAIEAAGATVVRVPASEGRTDLPAVLGKLGGLGINDVLVEAGPTLAGSLLSAALVDELVIYQAPHMMGSETRGMAHTPGWQALSQRLPLRITDLRRIGPDIRITATPGH